jgi:hypothetical protein
MISASLSLLLALGPSTAVGATLRLSTDAMRALDDWAATFEPKAVGSYLGDERPKVIVIAANEEAGAASKALRGALVQSGRTGLVMDDAAVGSVEGLDDAAIVERAKSQPVDTIAVVRVFDAGEDPSDVVVMFYGVGGELTVALTGTAGAPIPERSIAPGSTGVSSGAAEAVAELTRDPEPTATEVELERAQRQYDAQYLWLEKWVGINAQSGLVITKWSTIKQGKYGNEVPGPQVYEILGRPDLARQYRTRRAIKYGVGISSIAAGVGLMAGGMGIVFGNTRARGANFGFDDPIGQGKTDPPVRVSSKAGYAMLGIGAGIMTFGSFFIRLFKPHPVSVPEMARLMDEYNRKLRKDLGLPKPRASIRLEPSVGLTNGGVVSGRF